MTSSLPQARRSTTSRDGTRIGYWQSGQGDPLLLVHGGTSDHTRWSPLLSMLEPHATVSAMDRRGRGGSGDADDYSIEREFEDVAAVIDAVAQEHDVPVDVFGHSLGALCSLEAALITTNIRKLALYEAPTHPQALPDMMGLVDALDALIAEGRREEALERFIREGVRAPDEEIALLRKTPAWSVRVSLVHTIGRELRAVDAYRFDAARFRSLRVPVLLLWGGDHSPDVSLGAAANEVAGAFADVTVRELPGQRHMAMDTAPQMFVDSLIEFFDHAATG